MEASGLTWGDVLWNQGKLRVHASWTEHHEGKGTCYVPIRDVRPHLAEAFETVLPNGNRSIRANGAVIMRFAETNRNLDTPVKVIPHKAGLVPRPKMFQNPRADCETNWLDQVHPALVVAAWIGQSVKVQSPSCA